MGAVLSVAAGLGDPNGGALIKDSDGRVGSHGSWVGPLRFVIDLRLREVAHH